MTNWTPPTDGCSRRFPQGWKKSFPSAQAAHLSKEKKDCALCCASRFLFSWWSVTALARQRGVQPRSIRARQSSSAAWSTSPMGPQLLAVLRALKPRACPSHVEQAPLKAHPELEDSVAQCRFLSDTPVLTLSQVRWSRKQPDLEVAYPKCLSSIHRSGHPHLFYGWDCHLPTLHLPSNECGSWKCRGPLRLTSLWQLLRHILPFGLNRDRGTVGCTKARPKAPCS